jgi:hypothetical protein
MKFIKTFESFDMHNSDWNVDVQFLSIKNSKDKSTEEIFEDVMEYIHDAYATNLNQKIDQSLRRLLSEEFDVIFDEEPVDYADFNLVIEEDIWHEKLNNISYDERLWIILSAMSDAMDLKERRDMRMYFSNELGYKQLGYGESSAY